MRLLNFDFIIKHRLEKINSVNASSRRSDYHDVNTKITRLLFILQTKLRMIDVVQLRFSNMRATIIDVHASISRIVSYENEISKSEVATSVFILSKKRHLCDDLTQCLSRSIIAFMTTEKNSYDDNFESILNLIKALQQKNVFIQTRFEEIKASDKRRRDDEIQSNYTLKNEFLKFQRRYYVSQKESLRAELLKRHHDDMLIDHFDVTKTVELFKRKYY